MAQAQFNMPAVNRSVQTVMHDENGNPILIIGMREFTVIEPDGTVSEHKIGDSILLQDGLAWNPSLATGADPVLLTACSICRNPPVAFFRRHRSGNHLLAVRNSRTCVDCGAVVCSAHRRLSGGHWRCLKCARWYRFKRLIRPIFFSLHEEP